MKNPTIRNHQCQFPCCAPLLGNSAVAPLVAQRLRNQNRNHQVDAKAIVPRPGDRARMLASKSTNHKQYQWVSSAPAVHAEQLQGRPRGAVFIEKSDLLEDPLKVTQTTVTQKVAQARTVQPAHFTTPLRQEITKMQPKPQPDPDGVSATAIVRVEQGAPRRFYSTLADGGMLASAEKPAVGDIAVSPNLGGSFTMTKEAFDLAYEECNPVVDTEVTYAPGFVINVRTTHRKRPPCK